jgi:hypothetical protein
LKIPATKSPVVAFFEAAEAKRAGLIRRAVGVQTGGVSWLVADREFYSSDRRMSGEGGKRLQIAN